MDGGGGATYCTINASNLMDSTKYNSYSYFKVYDKAGLLSLDDNEDRNKFGNYSGKVIYLEANIDLGWTKRGAINAERGFVFSKDFDGVFDGKGHTISNAYHHAERGGFFCLDLSGTVRNVKFSNIMRTATANVGYVFSNWSVEIIRSVTQKWVEYVQPKAAPSLKDGQWVSTTGNITSVTITPVFAEETYKINFANATLGSYSNSASTTSITAKYGQTITRSISHTASATTITYIIGSNTITYSLAAKYTIDSYGSINGTAITNNMTVPGLTHNATYTITPTIKLRQHNSEFS